MRSVHFPLLLLILLLSAVVWGQPQEIDGDTRMEEDGRISGQLNAENPRDVFYVEGLRGEVIHFDLAVTEGDLDPVLNIFDDTGRLILRRDDGAGGLGAQHDLIIETTGRYFVVISRFGQSLGSTAGDYELHMTRKGVLSERGSSLRYDDSVIGTISDSNSEVYYTFQAEQGDILTISMVRSSGTLDPYLRVVDADRFLIAENDDQVGADTRNAQIDALIIERSGTYLIVATRYDDSSGSFVLRIEEAENSGSGSTRLAPLPLGYGESKIGSLSHGQFERYYTFQAAAGDLVTIEMQRGGSGDLDPMLMLADADYQPLVEDDDSGDNQNARIADFRIPAAGKYHIIATRFERGRGSTSGEYTLSLEVLEDPAVEAPPGTVSLSYGSSVTGKISADNEQDLYAFYGRRGEVITLSMTRVDGNLDAYLELLNGAQEVLAANDDGGSAQNALISNFAIPSTGMFYIRARRFAGDNGDSNTAGSYVLVLAERFN